MTREARAGAPPWALLVLIGGLLPACTPSAILSGSVPQTTTPPAIGTATTEPPAGLSSPTPRTVVTVAAPVTRGPLPGRALTIVTLGDSLTEGEGDALGNEGGYPARLGELMSVERPGSRVINLGKSGWISDQLVADQLPAAMRAQPDLALIWIGSNDLGYNAAAGPATEGGA